MVAKVGCRRVIVHNDGHAPTRQRANISHELAHVLLFHKGKAIDGGWLTYDAEQEDEAKWLGGVLVVTDEACIGGCRAGLSLANAAVELGVSEDLMRWRRNKSGAETRVRRELRRGTSTRARTPS
jgi:Zn-dependent peptidase ImmA (M78 family)